MAAVSPELARGPAGTGWPGEGLCDRQPLAGHRPFRRDGRVVPVSALGDQQTEVERRAGHPVSGAGWPSGPHRTGRGDELDPDRLGRRQQLVRCVAECAGCDADMRDVPEPVRRIALSTDGVRDPSA